MNTSLRTLLFLSSFAILSSLAAAEDEAVCVDQAVRVVSIVEAGEFSDLVPHLPADLTEHPEFVPKTLQIIVDEWGYPTSIQPDSSITPKDLAKAGFGSEVPSETLELYAFRAVFTLENEGGLYFKLSPKEDCQIKEFAFGLPISREGSRKRSFQTLRRLGDEMAEFFD